MLVERSERVRERARRRHAHVPDAEAVEQPIDRAVLGGRDRRAQVGDRLVLEVRSAGRAARRQAEDVRRDRAISSLEQLAGGALAEVLDVHRAARPRSGRCGPRSAPGSARFGQRGDGLALGTDERRAAGGAVLGHHERPLRARCAGSGSGATTSGITSPARAHDDGVADAARPCARPRRRCAASPSRSSRRRPRTGSSTANGVTAPVRPTLTWMSRSTVDCSSGGNL